MFAWIRRVYDWMGSKVHSPYALVWLSFLFFVESSVFFIPVDPLLILFCVENSVKAFYYAAISTVSSVVGGAFGYLIGWLLWDTVGSLIVHYIISEQTFAGIVQQYKIYQTWAVLIAGFTPVPYKAVTISAGFCKLPFIPFIAYSCLARGARFFLIAGAIKLWGEQIKDAIDRFFNYLVVAFIVIVVLSFSILKGTNMIDLPMPKIKEIEALAQAQPDCLSFSQGALKIGGVDSQIKEYASQLLETDQADYYNAPLGLLSLRSKLAATLSKQYDIRIGIENIAVSHGGVGALTALALTVLDAGDEVLLPEPAYPVYNNIARFCKAKPVFVNVNSMVKKDGKFTWFFDLDALKKAITPATRMIMLANPSNPTGAFLDQKTLTGLKNICEDRGIYLVLDEVYDDYIFSERPFVSGTSWATKSHFVVRIGSFSKSFGMSGWRVGYLVGHPRLVKAIAPVQASTLSCPTMIAQYAALYALEHKQDIMSGYIEKVRKSRNLACNFFDLLQERGLIEYVQPDAGFYIFFNVPYVDSLSFVMDVLKNVGVAMSPGLDFGKNYTSFVRFCFAREPEVVQQGLDRLKKYFSDKQTTHYTKPLSQTL